MRHGGRAAHAMSNLIVPFLYELRRRKKRWGVATACIGGGQGIAAVVEAIP